MAKNLAISHKTSTVAGKEPLPANLERGELAINLEDHILFTKDQNDAIIKLGGGGRVIIADAAPAVEKDKLWWDSSTGQLYVGYDDGNSKQWVGVGGPPGNDGVDAPTNTYLPLAGGSMAGPLELLAAALPGATDSSGKVPTTSWVKALLEDGRTRWGGHRIYSTTTPPAGLSVYSYTVVQWSVPGASGGGSVPFQLIFLDAGGTDVNGQLTINWAHPFANEPVVIVSPRDPNWISAGSGVFANVVNPQPTLVGIQQTSVGAGTVTPRPGASTSIVAFGLAAALIP